MEITQTERGTICNIKDVINSKECFIKIILGNNEKFIIEDLVKTLKNIQEKNGNVQFFTYNRREFTSFLLSRLMKYNKEKQDLIPMNKWRIEDIKEKLGNFNDEKITFEYFGLPPITNKVFRLKDMANDKNEIALFFSNSIRKIKNLSELTSRLLDNTYQENFLSKIVVTFEIEPELDRMEEFKKTFDYLKDENEETLIRFMKNNFAFSRLLGVSLCKITDKVIEDDIKQIEI